MNVYSYARQVKAVLLVELAIVGCAFAVAFFFWKNLCDNTLESCLAQGTLLKPLTFLLLSAVRPFVFTPLLFVAIIGGKATDVIDAGHFLSQAFGDWFGSGRTQVAAEKPKKVLVVDDSPFFRNMLTPLLSIAGYEVTSAESADQALQMQEAGVEVDVIVSDIEMPGTDGFAFAEAVRSHGRWREKPMVALTSRTSPGDLEIGRAHV